jgi:hypothetical protein
MKLIFVSGAYRAKDKIGVSKNIKLAREASKKLWQQGYAVICPHMNTAHFDGICPDDYFLDGDIEMMIRCDAVYLLKNWEESEGAREEHNIALSRGMEIIYQ